MPKCSCCGSREGTCLPPFRNFYRHEACGTKWEDVWCGMCNDRCPTCNVECEPYESEEA
jgi:hypothetical protein